MGTGLDTLRHLGIARHFALYRLNFEFVRDQRGSIFGRHSTAQLLEKAPIKTTRFRHDSDRLAQFRFDHGPTNVRMVSIVKSALKCHELIGFFFDFRYDAERHSQKICRYNRNTGYVIYSAMGSFFIPMVVMLYVYVRISCVIAQRHDQLSHINTSFTRVSFMLLLYMDNFLIINLQKSKQNGMTIEESDIERISGETEEGNAR